MSHFLITHILPPVFPILKIGLDIMGAVDQTIFFEMAEAIARKDAKKAMTLVEEMMISGRDVKQFVTEMLQHLRNLLMAATIPDAGMVLDQIGRAHV